MTWHRIHKHFQGGRTPRDPNEFDYIEVPNGTKRDEVRDYAEDWADRTPGGHAYGYRVYWSRVRRPSKQWLQNRINCLENRLKGYRKREMTRIDEDIKKMKEELKKFKNI